MDKNEFNASVARRIKQACKVSDLTVIALSEASDVPKKSLDDYVRGKGMSLYAAAKLAHALRVPLDWLASLSGSTRKTVVNGKVYLEQAGKHEAVERIWEYRDYLDSSLNSNCFYDDLATRAQGMLPNEIIALPTNNTGRKEALDALDAFKDLMRRQKREAEEAGARLDTALAAVEEWL